MDVYVHRAVSVTVKHRFINSESLNSESPFWVTHIIIKEDGVAIPHVIKLFSNGIEKLIIQEEK